MNLISQSLWKYFFTIRYFDLRNIKTFTISHLLKHVHSHSKYSANPQPKWLLSPQLRIFRKFLFKYSTYLIERTGPAKYTAKKSLMIIRPDIIHLAHKLSCMCKYSLSAHVLKLLWLCWGSYKFNKRALVAITLSKLLN